MKKRKICIATGTRAEYGLLYHIMKNIKIDDALELQILVTGMHLSPEFGLTYKIIEEDGFFINEKVEMILSSDNSTGIVKSMGIGLIGFADSLQRLHPDIVVVLGDRYEILALAEAAMIMNIPLAHIHGGEISEGAVDDAIRHAITKLAQVHFVSNEVHRHRVIQLGESPARVFEVGAPGVDNIIKLEYMSLPKLEQSINFRLTEKFFLVTYHPVTRQVGQNIAAIKEIFSALDQFPTYKVLFTKGNSDAEGRKLNELIDNYTKQNKNRVCSVISLGQVRYLSAMKFCSAVIGNSSSGIWEAPVLRKVTINIGDRQKGRASAPSVINCKPVKKSIVEALYFGLNNEFNISLELDNIRYTDGNVSQRIVEILKTIDLTNICQKKFYDLK